MQYKDLRNALLVILFIYFSPATPGDVIGMSGIIFQPEWVKTNNFLDVRSESRELVAWEL